MHAENYISFGVLLHAPCHCLFVLLLYNNSNNNLHVLKGHLDNFIKAFNPAFWKLVSKAVLKRRAQSGSKIHL